MPNQHDLHAVNQLQICACVSLLKRLKNSEITKIYEVSQEFAAIRTLFTMKSLEELEI